MKARMRSVNNASFPGTSELDGPTRLCLSCPPFPGVDTILLDIIRSRVRCSPSNAIACKRNRCRTHDKGARTVATHYTTTHSIGPSTSSRPRSRQRRPVAFAPQSVTHDAATCRDRWERAQARLAQPQPPAPNHGRTNLQSEQRQPPFSPDLPLLPANLLGPSPERLRSDLPCPTEQGQLQPLPMAVDIVKSNLSQPVELSFQADQFVGWILVRLRDAERLQKLPMELV